MLDGRRLRLEARRFAWSCCLLLGELHDIARRNFGSAKSILARTSSHLLRDDIEHEIHKTGKHTVSNVIDCSIVHFIMSVFVLFAKRDNYRAETQAERAV